MKRFILNFLLAAAFTILALALKPPAHGLTPPQASDPQSNQTASQQADEDRNSTAPRKADPAAVPPQQSNEGQIPASGEATTEEAKTFSGTVIKENGQLILKDPVTKVSYKFDDPSKAKQYVGKQVKVTGKLGLNSNTIRIETIEVL
jgi:hypothetical protein